MRTRVILLVNIIILQVNMGNCLCLFKDSVISVEEYVIKVDTTVMEKIRDFIVRILYESGRGPQPADRIFYMMIIHNILYDDNP